ncbi:metallophosphoesterase [Methanomassiliicoccus luminyensis]|uniref:metallophosphoesterase n=1 Tax=Methanomassiliicoccus luminyensis TaxID=1080712 RepID=UPI000365A6DB|nr:metallophosphoesterase [Methanomassiliicoccus luminyensis]
MDRIEAFKGVYMTSEQCLLIPEERTAVVADLHIGYESALEAEGIHIPHVQTASVKENLLKIIDKYALDRIILLGDLKHEFSRNLGQEMRDVRSVMEMLSNLVEVILVKGNHDNYIENIVSRIQVPVVPLYRAAGLTFVHGHQPCADRPLVMGHEHPSVKIFDRVGAYLKLPCFVHLREEGVLVLPAFSPLAAGTDLTRVSKRDYLSPILKNYDVGEAEIIGCSDIGLLPLGKLSTLEGLRL